MTNSGAFRRASPRDAQLIAEIHAQSFPRGWGVHEVADLLSQSAVSGIIAPRDAGFALWRVAADEAEIISLAVRPVARRTGLADRMMAIMQSSAREQGARTLFLEVAVTNEPAVRLYEKLGFEKVGRRPEYYRAAENRVDAWTMRRSLDIATQHV